MTDMEHPAATLTREGMIQQEIQLLLNQATPERRGIFEKLQEKQWFQQTDPSIQKALLTLPSHGQENHDGFLDDLARRPEEVANIKVERMIDLPHGSFALVPKFEVSRLDNPSMRYTYEYVSWRTGPLSGAKGVVFVEKDGQTTHFIVLRGDKFAPGKPVWDTVGGFIDLNADGVTHLDERVVHEIHEELGGNDITINNVVSLGKVLPDAGMTNNEPSLFAAFIGSGDLSRLSAYPVNPDIYELKSGAVIFPIEQLPDVVMENSDGYFLSTIARAWAKGIIAPPHTLIGTSVGFSPN